MYVCSNKYFKKNKYVACSGFPALLLSQLQNRKIGIRIQWKYSLQVQFSQETWFDVNEALGKSL